jgi:hypothetical protein
MTRGSPMHNPLNLNNIDFGDKSFNMEPDISSQSLGNEEYVNPFDFDKKRLNTIMSRQARRIPSITVDDASPASPEKSNLEEAQIKQSSGFGNFINFFSK